MDHAQPEDLAEIRELLLEYAAWLRVDLAFQHFGQEVDGLPASITRARARGAGLGRQQTERVIDEARTRGYQEMVLDTLPVMRGAQQLSCRAWLP